MKRLFLAVLLIAAPVQAQQILAHDDETSAAAGDLPDKYVTATAVAGDKYGLDVVSSAGSSIDFSVTEDAAETAGGKLAAVGTVRRDTPASSAGTSGDNATLNTDASGYLWTNDGSQYAEDSAHTSGDRGTFVMGVQNSLGSALNPGTNGDYVPFSANTQGAAYVSVRRTMQDGSGADGLLKSEDAASADGDAGVAVYGKVYTTVTSSAVSTIGDYSPAHISSTIGGYYVDPVASTARVCTAITPDTNAYAAGDAVLGAGPITDPLTLASVFRTNVNSGTLTSIDITNTEVDGIAWDVCLFTADPTASTTTDNAAMAVAAADLQKWLGCIPVTVNTAGAATEIYSARNINLLIDGASTSLYIVPRTTGAPTWAAAQTVNVCLTFAQD